VTEDRGSLRGLCRITAANTTAAMATAQLITI
jgi:hypothetical protein